MADFDRDVTDPDHDILVWPDELAMGVLGGCLACNGPCPWWFTRWGRGREVCVHPSLHCRSGVSDLLTAALARGGGEAAAPAQASSRRRGRGVYARGEQVAEAPRSRVSVLGPGADLPGTGSRFYKPGRCPTPWVVVGPAGIVPCRLEATAAATARHLVAGGADRVTVVDPDDHETILTG